MSDDSISRQAAIDAMCDNCDTVNADCPHYPCSRYLAVRKLPSAQQWIPCSEKLPRLDEEVLATTAWNDITIALRIGIDKWFIHEGNTNATTEDLIAWCPLPEPYKMEVENDE